MIGICFMYVLCSLERKSSQKQIAAGSHGTVIKIHTTTARKAVKFLNSLFMERADRLITVGAVIAAIAVALGAFGAHIVKDMVSPERLGNWETAAQYQFYHALAIIATGIIAHFRQDELLRKAGLVFGIGILLFSFSLYTLALTDLTWLGAITPLGGVSFIAGWLMLAKASFSLQKAEEATADGDEDEAFTQNDIFLDR